MTLGTILIIIGILGGICAIYLPIITTNENFVWFVFLIFLIPVGVIKLDKKSKPTFEDVIKGTAMYQEHLIITNNDTIKTYEIIWKDK